MIATLGTGEQWLPGYRIRVLDDEVWEPFHTRAPRVFAKHLVAGAAHSDWQRFRKAVRGPGKPTPKHNRFKDKPHVSTARLLAE